MKRDVIKVDQDGFVDDIVSLSNEEIETAILDGVLIIKQGWNEQLFQPKWDFESNKWIEGLSIEEVKRKKQEINEHQNKMTDTNIQALAILELAIEVEKNKGGI